MAHAGGAQLRDAMAAFIEGIERKFVTVGLATNGRWRHRSEVDDERLDIIRPLDAYRTAVEACEQDDRVRPRILSR